MIITLTERVEETIRVLEATFTGDLAQRHVRNVRDLLAEAHRLREENKRLQADVDLGHTVESDLRKRLAYLACGADMKRIEEAEEEERGNP